MQPPDDRLCRHSTRLTGREPPRTRAQQWHCHCRRRIATRSGRVGKRQLQSGCIALCQQWLGTGIVFVKGRCRVHHSIIRLTQRAIPRRRRHGRSHWTGVSALYRCSQSDPLQLGLKFPSSPLMDQSIHDTDWIQHTVSHLHTTPLRNVPQGLPVLVHARDGLCGNRSTPRKVGKFATTRQVGIARVDQYPSVVAPDTKLMVVRRLRRLYGHGWKAAAAKICDNARGGPHLNNSDRRFRNKFMDKSGCDSGSKQGCRRRSCHGAESERFELFFRMTVECHLTSFMSLQSFCEVLTIL